MIGWKRATLAELASPEKYALATGPFGSAISAKNFVDHGVPVIRGSNLSLDVGVRLNDDGLAFLTEAKAATFKRSAARRGDLVFTCWGTIGQIGLIDDRAQYAQYIVSNKQMKLTPDPTKIDSVYLYYLLSSPDMVSMVTGQSIGAAVPGFNLGQLKNIAVNVPPLGVQKDVASVLVGIDDLIQNNQRRVGLLDEMARAIYREWFVNFRYPGHESVPLVDSALGPIPEGWVVSSLSSIASIALGQSPRSEFYNDAGLGKPFHQGVTDFGSHFPRTRKWCSVEGRSAVEGDILISVRAPVGRINIADTEITIGRGLSAVRAKDGRQGLLLGHIREAFAAEDSMGNDGAIFKSLGKAELSAVPVIVAPAEVADQADRILSDNLDLIRTLSDATARLVSMRDLLLPKLVTGQIDVSALDLDRVLEEAVA